MRMPPPIVDQARTTESARSAIVFGPPGLVMLVGREQGNKNIPKYIAAVSVSTHLPPGFVRQEIMHAGGRSWAKRCGRRQSRWETLHTHGSVTYFYDESQIYPSAGQATLIHVRFAFVFQTNMVDVRRTAKRLRSPLT